ncbi:DMT family transporter [Roseiterribacter gracilis]|uniref:Multidrug DMT transporter permease n=1 Tax=Roseiterribacter gracilis TaxID=2812848 RepID=A0A8S8XA39_9PROT|nr:multidrug DMT transporter permease [Rhodospirillales bacterium TMPK1]
MQEKTRGMIEMTGAMTVSGTIGVFVVLSGQSFTDVVFWRCVFGALTLLAVCAALGFLRRDVMTKRQFALAVLGGVFLVVNWLLLFAAFPRTSISIATTVYNTQPFMLVVLGALLLGEKPTVAKVGWLVVAFIGLLLIVAAKNDTTIGTDYLGGILLALGAAFFYAAVAIVAKQLKGVPPHLIALIQVTVGIVMLAPFAGDGGFATDMHGFLCLVTIGVVHTGLLYIVLYGAMQRLPTHLIGALSFVYPIVAILADYVVLDRHLQPLQLVGGAIILFAAAATATDARFSFLFRSQRGAAIAAASCASQRQN